MFFDRGAGSVDCCHWLGVYPKSYTLNPMPYALCPIPYTLYPIPYTLYPMPGLEVWTAATGWVCTLNPIPYTLFPNPMS